MKQIQLLFTAALFMIVTGCQAITGETLGQNIDDATLTSYVKTKLVADKAANLTRVDVDTTRGVVYLSGVVDSEEQRSRAEQLARQVGGVRTVVNNLQVQRR
ncbi:MAG: BON domain-containing protein [Candidatus Binatia bacterium]